MQASLSIISPTLIPLKPSKKPSQLTLFPSKLSTSFTFRNSSVKANVVTTNNTNTVNYNSLFSVFPAEACETIGGEACWEGMFPEAKLQQKQTDSTSTSTSSSETFEREYFEYNDPKTVFRREACDDLGGEFCEHDYQKSVY
uniref:Light-regulated protein n=1 Tax=Cannabis sativa TaxID=3483 RepID=A0A803QKY5_CANSA